MQISQQGLDLIKSFESLRLTSYLDSRGIPTIGYGCTKGVSLGELITAQEAEEMLGAAVGATQTAVSRLITEELKQNEFDALCSLVYNIGMGAFESSHLRSVLNLGLK